MPSAGTRQVPRSTEGISAMSLGMGRPSALIEVNPRETNSWIWNGAAVVLSRTAESTRGSPAIPTTSWRTPCPVAEPAAPLPPAATPDDEGAAGAQPPSTTTAPITRAHHARHPSNGFTPTTPLLPVGEAGGRRHATWPRALHSPHGDNTAPTGHSAAAAS